MKNRILAASLALAMIFGSTLLAQRPIGPRGDGRPGKGPHCKDSTRATRPVLNLDSLREVRKAEMDAIRAQIKAKEAELKAAVEAGTMTKEEARKAMGEFLKSLRPAKGNK
jgi:Skp family chaperone for outer membrane proteins